MNINDLLKYIAGASTPEEESLTRDWLADDPDGSHARLYREAHFLYEGMTLYGGTENADRPAGAKHRSTTIARIWKWAAAAAVAILVAGSTAVMVRNSTIDSLSAKVERIYVPEGKTMELTLEDGSHLWLNSDTEIEYPAIFARKSRTVRLMKGEVLFDVSHDEDRPFRVSTFASEVNVLGTKFDVVADEENGIFSTALLRGSVRVDNSMNAGDMVLLSPNQKVVMSDGRLVVYDLLDISSVVCWKDGLLDLTGVPFNELMHKMEKAFGVSIVIEREAMPEVRYTRGKVRVTDGVDHAMDMIARASDFSWSHDIETNTIIIR